MGFQFKLTMESNEVDLDHVIGFIYDDKSEKFYAKIVFELPVGAITTYSIGIGSSVNLQYGPFSGTTTDYYLFRGTVEKIEERGTSILITCFDKLFQLTQRLVNESYDSNDSYSGSIQFILIDLITRFGGLSADATTVDEVSGGVTLQNKLICIDSVAYEKCGDLLKVGKFIMYYDADSDKVYCHERGKNSSGTTFRTGVNIVGKPAWSKGSVFNYLKLYGSSRTIGVQEFFSGDGSTTDFQLTYVPDSKTDVVVEVYVGGSWVRNDVGISGADASYDCTIDDDPKIREVQFESGSIPASSTNNIRITYVRNSVLFTERWDDNSKSDYPLSDGGYRYKILTNKYITTIDDLENVAGSVLEVAKDPFESVTFKSSSLTLIPNMGTSTQIVDDMNVKDKSMNISGVTFTYPTQLFTINLEDVKGRVSDYLYTSQQRLTILEEESRGNLSVIRSTVQNTPTVQISITQLFSLFDTWSSIWDSSNDWDIASLWGSSPMSDDFSVDLGNWDEY